MSIAISGPCPCKSGKDYDGCCGPIIAGLIKPETAEALMRSRYTAHATGQFAYIAATTAPEKRDDIDLDDMRNQARGLEWVTLDIQEKEKGLVDDETGIVTFSARFIFNGKVQAHQERSRFRKDGDQWLYIDGDINPTLKSAEAAKVGRNDPCPCGSGKKYKKCCGGR